MEAALTRLAARGDLIELKSGQYVVTARTREFAVGRLNLHRDGYGFLISERPIPGIAGDIFIPPEAAEKAMHGDRVIVRIARIEAGGRADGEIVKVLKRAHPTVVGEFQIGRRGCYVVPADDRIHQWIDIPEGMELPPAGAPTVDRIGVTPPKVSSVAELDGMVVNVELLEYPERGASPVGRVIEILGHPDDFGVDVEIVIRKHHLPHQFPPEVIEQAQAMPAAIAEADLAGRRDFRDMPIVTIDGETARDFDDAVWVDRLRQRQLRAARPHRRRQPLRAPEFAHRSRSPTARHQRLLPRSRRAHAALRAFHQPLLARPPAGPPGALRAHGDRSSRRGGRPGVHRRA